LYHGYSGNSAPFFGRKPYRLNVPKFCGGVNYIKETNLDSFTMQVCNLVKAGFGSLREIEELDSDRFLDLIEYEAISMDINAYISKGE